MTDTFDTEPGSDQTSATEHEPGVTVRQQSFDAEGPVELDLGVGAGRIEVRLADKPGLHVEIRHDPASASPWTAGMSSLLTWFSGQFGDEVGELSPMEAVRQTRIDLTGGRLVVRTPKALPLRTVPIAVTVTAPAGSQVSTRSSSADVLVSGAATRLDLQTGSGDVSADHAAGPARVQTSSGAVRLGPMLAGLRARTGTGDVEVSSVGGPTTLFTGSGDIWLGTVSGDVMARTGSGDVTVAEAASGQIELQTGSGAIRVGVRPGAAAEIDMSSATGEARSELRLSGTRPDTEPPLRIRGRTASGSAVVTQATH